MMERMTYEESDFLRAALRHRTDLVRYVPRGGDDLAGGDDPAEWRHHFWSDVAARFRRGEWADAITAIERMFGARRTKKGDAKTMAAAHKRKVPA